MVELTAALHHSREPDRPVAPPAQPPEEAGSGVRREREQQVGSGLGDSPDRTETAANQNDEEYDLPEERHPSLKEGAFLFTVVAAGR